MPDLVLARRILALTDLTELGDTCTEIGIDRLVAAAKGPHGTVAAVCLWPQFVKKAKAALGGSGVKVATVINFPAGRDDVDRVVEDSEEALRDGADEIDLVMPYRAFLAGNTAIAGDMIEAVKELLPEPRLLKVILETGEYPSLDAVAAASRLAIDAGADFLKTSTGKTRVSATPAAARAMLEVIRDSTPIVGFKAAGGIRTLGDAATYLGLAETILGPHWATRRTFRIGASSLVANLVAALDGHKSDPSAGKAGY
jgi:deoxyribose-phosphate aldolase